jgi:FAD:protein FMN transferase
LMAVSGFNAARTLEWQPVPAELAQMVQEALILAQETGGALDVTLAPLIDLWGYGALPRPKQPPSAAEVRAIQKHCGWRLLEARAEPPALRKKHAEVRINLSSIAEGWALRELAKVLQQRNVSHYLLELGGELLAKGESATGKPWRVAVQMAEGSAGYVSPALPLEDACLATAGSYRQQYEHEGRRYSHLLDPRTGEPVLHALRSVSVLHASPLLADAYATTLMILGPEEGRRFAEKKDLRVLE